MHSEARRHLMNSERLHLCCFCVTLGLFAWLPNMRNIASYDLYKISLEAMNLLRLYKCVFHKLTMTCYGVLTHLATIWQTIQQLYRDNHVYTVAKG